MKISPKELAVLRYMDQMENKSSSGYRLKCEGLGNTGTLRRLADKRLVSPYGLGHMAFPANGQYCLTKAGENAARGL